MNRDRPQNRPKTGAKLNAETALNPSEKDPAIQEIAQIEREAYESRSWMDHFAGSITRKAGSATAILIHTIWFFVWLLLNLNIIPGFVPFDPFPFSLLTMVVSLEAIFLTLFVLISQNRMSKEADRRAELDLEVNILAEKEATLILQMLRQISEKLGVTPPPKADMPTLMKETNVGELSKKLEEVLPPD